MASDWPARVLAGLDEAAAELVGLLGELVRVPSVTGTVPEHELQDRLARWLAAEGVEVDHWRLPLAELVAEPGFPGTEAPRTEGWGLVGRLPGRGGGRSLLLDAHVDVVPPGDRAGWTGGDPYAGAVRAGRLHGRGACDMKAGLAAALVVTAVLRRTGVPLRGDVLVGCVQSEEDGGLGTYALVRRGWRADLCVVPEPTGLDLVPGCAGALTFRLRVPGRATHASRRTEGVSAVEKLVPVLAALRALEARRNAAVDPLVSRWSLPYPISIGTVAAGDWASTVPALLVAEGRLGVALGEPVAAARAELETALAKAGAADPWLAAHPVTVEWWGGQFAPGLLPAGTDLLDRVRRAHAAAVGRPQQVWAAPYGSDLRLLTAAGIPTVHYGPGDAALAHAPDESVPVSEVLECARTLALLALDVCGVG